MRFSFPDNTLKWERRTTMSKSTILRIVLIAGSVLIIVGVALMTWMLATEEERNVIQINISDMSDDGATKTIEFESLGLVPGEECEYTLKLKSDNSKKYDLYLDFVEVEEKTLKEFARVRIVSNGEIVCDELLADAFLMEPLVLPVDFTENRNTEMRIVYYLPIEIGNEAKNAEAVFDLILTATNE